MSPSKSSLAPSSSAFVATAQPFPLWPHPRPLSTAVERGANTVYSAHRFPLSEFGEEARGEVNLLCRKRHLAGGAVIRSDLLEARTIGFHPVNAEGRHRLVAILVQVSLYLRADVVIGNERHDLLHRLAIVPGEDEGQHGDIGSIVSIVGERPRLLVVLLLE